MKGDPEQQVHPAGGVYCTARGYRPRRSSEVWLQQIDSAYRSNNTEQFVEWVQ